MWMFSGGIPNSPATRPCAMARPWLGVSMDSLSPSHAATIACGSIGVVVLRRRFVGRVDAPGCRREARLDIAAMRLGRRADAHSGRDEALAGVETDPGRLGLVAGRQERGAFGRGLERRRR